MRRSVAAVTLLLGMTLGVRAGAQSGVVPENNPNPGRAALSRVGGATPGRDSTVDTSPRAYSRGARELRQARRTQDPAERRQHLSAAMSHFKRSLALERNADALLGLGETALELGENQEAMQACQEALDWWSARKRAKVCFDQAVAALKRPAAPPASAPPPTTGRR